MAELLSCPSCNWASSLTTTHKEYNRFCNGTPIPDKECEPNKSQIILNPTRSDKTEVRTTSSTGGQKGVKLQRFDLIPVGPLTRLAEHYGRGALKYSDHNWRKGYEWSKSYAALQRHLTAWWNGEEYDVCPGTGEGCAFVTSEGEPFEGAPTEHGNTCYNHTGGHHLDGVKFHAFGLDELRLTHPEHDDRYNPTS